MHQIYIFPEPITPTLGKPGGTIELCNLHYSTKSHYMIPRICYTIVVMKETFILRLVLLSHWYMQWRETK